MACLLKAEISPTPWLYIELGWVSAFALYFDTKPINFKPACQRQFFAPRKDG
jgi:hypothetical protein